METFSISGTVTSGGQPVEEGSISFYDPKTGHAGQAALGSGGEYELELPAGTYRVAVEPPFVEVSAPETEPDLVYKDMPSIPEQYRTSSSSGLEAQVGSDAEGVNFDLTPAAD
ncbi:MAG: carboxypeptidase-like regulatory domain-containing protein [Planctomycetaceae bacterium]